MKQCEDILLFDFTRAACKMKWNIFFFFKHASLYKKDMKYKYSYLFKCKCKVQ